MLTLRYNKLIEKISNYKDLSILEKYKLGEKVYSVMMYDKQKLSEIFSNRLKYLWLMAETRVYNETSNGANIICDSSRREISIIFKDKNKDIIGSFFEIIDLAETLTQDTLERLVIIGFFMNEENMNIIQAFNLLDDKIKQILANS